MESTINNVDIPRMAISLKQLLAFRDGNYDQLQSMTTREVVDHIIKPETKAKDCSYVKYLNSECGRPKYIVSHALEGLFLDLVDAVENACESGDEEEWLWLDIFVMPLNTVGVDKDEKWHMNFADMVKEIGNMFIVLTSDEHAMHVQCPSLDEYFTAIRLLGQPEWKVTARIILPKHKMTNLKKYIVSGYDILNELGETHESRDDRVYASACDALQATCALREFPRMLGQMLMAIGQYEEAEKVLMVSIDGGDLRSYYQLALVYQRQGKKWDALVMQQQYLEVTKAFYSNNAEVKLELAKAYGGTGLAYSDVGREYQALDKFQKALDIFLEHLGDGHQHVGIFYYYIGRSYVNLRRYDDALLYLNKAYAVLKEALGENHPHVTDILGNMAIVCGYLNRHNEALELHQTVLKWYEVKYGHHHEAVAITMESIGLCFWEMGRRQEAENMCRHAYSILRQKLGPDDPKSRHAALALVQVMQGVEQKIVVEAAPASKKPSITICHSPRFDPSDALPVPVELDNREEKPISILYVGIGPAGLFGGVGGAVVVPHGDGRPKKEKHFSEGFGLSVEGGKGRWNWWW